MVVFSFWKVFILLVVYNDEIINIIWKDWGIKGEISNKRKLEGKV